MGPTDPVPHGALSIPVHPHGSYWGSESSSKERTIILLLLLTDTNICLCHHTTDWLYVKRLQRSACGYRSVPEALQQRHLADSTRTGIISKSDIQGRHCGRYLKEHIHHRAPIMFMQHITIPKSYSNWNKIRQHAVLYPQPSVCPGPQKPPSGPCISLCTYLTDTLLTHHSPSYLIWSVCEK